MAVAFRDLGRLSFGGLIRASLKLFLDHSLVFPLLFVLPSLAVFSLTLIVWLSTLAYEPSGLPGSPINVRGIWDNLPWSPKLLFIFAFLCHPLVVGLAQGTTQVAVNRVLLGRPPALKETLGGLRGKWVRLLGASLRFSVLFYVAPFLFIFPVLLLALFASMTIPALVAEKISFYPAFKRSAKVATKSFGRTFLLFLLSGLATLAAMVACWWLLNEFFAAFPFFGAEWRGRVNPLSVLRGYATFYLLPALGLSWLSVALALHYLDFRVRWEGLTHESLATSLGTS